VVSIASSSISEGFSGRRIMSFTLSLSAASTAPVSVRWATANGTARAGSDYRAASGTVVFAAGQTSRTIGVYVFGDRFVEADETFVVKLSTPLRATLSTASATAVGTILNDDGQFRAAVASAFAMMASPTAGSTGTKLR
jgi:chitinase